MRVLFITDPHVDFNISNTRGIDTKSRFLMALEHGISHHPELIVLGGDLCNDSGQEEVYRWFKLVLDNTGVPYHVIPGNHDDSTMMSDIFYGEKREECYRMHEFDKGVFVFLDSGRGNFTESQWIWLDNILSMQRNIVLFMHHPPTMIGSKHMEPTYSFTQIAAFEDLMKNLCGEVLPVFTGHFHMEGHVSKSKLNVYVTPSTYTQIDPSSEELKIITDKSAYRVIDLDNNGVRTFVQYLSY